MIHPIRTNFLTVNRSATRRTCLGSTILPIITLTPASAAFRWPRVGVRVSGRFYVDPGCNQRLGCWTRFSGAIRVTLVAHVLEKGTHFLKYDFISRRNWVTKNRCCEMFLDFHVEDTFPCPFSELCSGRWEGCIFQDKMDPSKFCRILVESPRIDIRDFLDSSSKSIDICRVPWAVALIEHCVCRTKP